MAFKRVLKWNYPNRKRTRRGRFSRRPGRRNFQSRVHNGLLQDPEMELQEEEDDESSWEVQSSAGSSELSESGMESDLEDSRDEVLRHWSPGQLTVSQPRSHRRTGSPAGD